LRRVSAAALAAITSRAGPRVAHFARVSAINASASAAADLPPSRGISRVLVRPGIGSRQNTMSVGLRLIFRRRRSRSVRRRTAAAVGTWSAAFAVAADALADALHDVDRELENVGEEVR